MDGGARRAPPLVDPLAEIMEVMLEHATHQLLAKSVAWSAARVQSSLVRYAGEYEEIEVGTISYLYGTKIVTSNVPLRIH
ncbi:hypothetical protein GCM10011487_69320 [Steroidobacter agaridevorans]|uniref:Uncharacterized protein n=1 Tax=Steroidobacter agaridevorans TaxID=2695856 RepID=A0A829YQ91_9GAMM|nr:hypothetical protein GCM10011487_69320 [Steroidobacter agaridevorans]